MTPVVLDFETYFDADFTLSKMTTEAYIRDPRFEALGVGVLWPNGYEWVAGPDLPAYFAGKDWSRIALIAHHAHFDGLILSHHYNVKPCIWFDTLSMARLVLGADKRVGLAALAEQFGLGAKSLDYNAFRGKRWRDMSEDMRLHMAQGCEQDTRLTLDLFHRLAKIFPMSEYAIVDMTIRMFTEPTLIGDAERLYKVRDDEFARKGERLLGLGVTEAQLQSGIKFVKLLEECGLDVPMKDTKAGQAPAIARSDAFMTESQAHADPRVRELVAARLDTKSTINETRSGRMADMATRGPMPVYLSYCGAHTTRWSGGDSVNWQNFPRGGDIQQSISAPAGHRLLVLDYSQIEARVLNTFAGQWDIVEAFASGRDLYSEGATRYYGRHVDKKTDPLARHMGKVLELGCGYGMGEVKLAQVCAIGALGGPPIIMQEGDAARGIASYRSSHEHVVALWAEANHIIRELAGRGEGTWRDILRYENGILYGPGGTRLNYQGLQRIDKNWMAVGKRGTTKLYGAKLVENVIQWLSRVIMSDAMRAIFLATGQAGHPLRPVMTKHDELVYCVPKRRAEALYAYVSAMMKLRPEWMPRVPLDVEGGVFERYEK